MSAPAPQAEQLTIEQQVMEIVRELLLQQGKERAAANLKPSSQFERDLGLASLDLVELMVRCEQKLELELPDEIAEQADTPAGWAKAIQQGTHEQSAESVYRIVPPSGVIAPEPAGARTLVDALRWHAEHTPGKTHVHLLEAGAGRGITCSQILDAAETVARGLLAQGVERGAPVAILLPNGEEFLYAFYGVILAGAVPMPLFPPADATRLCEYMERQANLLRKSGARFLIAFEQVRSLARMLRVSVPNVTGVAQVSTLLELGRRTHRRLPEASDTALLQFTSGSTGDPKAIPLTHANVLANIRAIGSRVSVNGRDALVSWLPLSSDLGLVGCWLFSLYYGIPLTLLSPKEFFERPDSWFWAIHDSRGTLSAAPNFAYEMCARRLPLASVEGVDLSCWRLAVNAGEAVIGETIEHFSRRFAAIGFRPEAMSPGYGLAEAGVALALTEPDEGPRCDADGFYSVGRPLDCAEVRIHNGHVQFRAVSQSPSLHGEDGWTDSGDLGYLSEDGRLTVTGRSKDIIVRKGRTLSPQQMEAAALQATGVRAGSAAAIGVKDLDSGSERLVVIVESIAENASEQRRVSEGVRRSVEAALGEPPDEVFVIAPGTLPKTANGKLRRGEAIQHYRQRSLGREGRPAPVEMAALWQRNFGALAWAGVTRWFRNATQRIRFNLARAVARVGGAAISASGRPHWTGGFARLALSLAGRRAVLEGTLPASGCLIVANRCGHPDPVALAACLPRRVTLAGSEALLGVLGASESLLLHSVASTHEELLAAFRRGDAVVLFPDAPVGVSAARCRFRLPALRAAQEAGVPVVPLALDEFRLRTTARAGEAIQPGASVVELRNRVREAIAGLYA
ncbi:MAG: AMP-binding protein [Bryobacterales bacterium]|nr:AMP-binding protein [Bryobacterales bacterium]